MFPSRLAFWLVMILLGVAALGCIVAAFVMSRTHDRAPRSRWRRPGRERRPGKEISESIAMPAQQPVGRVHVSEAARGNADYQRRNTPSGRSVVMSDRLLDDPPPGPDQNRPAPEAPAVVPEPRSAPAPVATVEYAMQPEQAIAPRFVPGSRVSQLPWELPLESASPPGVAADQGTLGDLRVRAASVIGAGHRSGRSIKPRQDAYRVARDRAGRHLVVAVADGMSDSARAEFGASVAVGTAVALVRRHLDDALPLAGLQPAELFSEVANALVQAARERRLEANDVRTTLAVAVLPTRSETDRPVQGWVAQVADTHLWRRTEDGWDCLTGMTKDSFDGSVLDAFLPHVPKAARGGLFEMRYGDTIAVLSDGVSDAFSTVAGAACWFARRWREPPPLASFLLDVDYEAKTMQDDRTAVVVWNGEAAHR